MGKKKPVRKNRYKKRKGQKRRRIIGGLAIGFKLASLLVMMVAVSALFMAGYAAVTQASYFRTRAIKIQGASRLSEAAVLNQAGVHKGDNILAVNLNLVRKRLLAHPWISSARVAREIPETIRIIITEHRPLAVLDLGRKFLVNESGRIFKEKDDGDPEALPLVTGIIYADISLGEEPLSSVMKTVVKVLKMSKNARSVIPYTDIRILHMDAEMGVTLSVWEEERKIKLGLSRFEYKYKRLKRLLPHLRYNPDWEGFRSIDANNPDRIVVQL